MVEPLEQREEFDPVTGVWHNRSRPAVRVPVIGQELDVTVRAAGGRAWTPEGLDLSISGILVEFSPGTAPDIETGAELQVILRSDKHVVTLQAEVMRRDGYRYGIAFMPELGGHEAPLKPDPLRALVAALERRWLASRVRL